jgi:mono/diheme cytochrome c family protein
MRRVSGALVVFLGLMGASACGGGEVQLVPGDPAAGEEVYQAECAECHGEAGEGTADGSPLVDPLYLAPGFTDRKLARAVREGAPQEHWDFGAMPGLRYLTDRQISDVVAYVRRMQGR